MIILAKIITSTPDMNPEASHPNHPPHRLVSVTCTVSVSDANSDVTAVLSAALVDKTLCRLSISVSLLFRRSS